MIVLGLTGSIAMGKSTAARMLAMMGLPLHDADATVHRLIGPKGLALEKIAKAFPGVVGNKGVDRQVLGAQVFGNPEALERLESILHPMVRAEASRFLKRQRARRSPLVVLDIPLLFETGGDVLCDAIMVVTAPLFLQKARALGRSGMTEQKLQAIRARQMPEVQKKRRADFVVQTGLGKGYTFRRIKKIVNALRQRT